MTLVSKFAVCIMILFAAASSQASLNEPALTEAMAVYQELCQQDGVAHPFMEVMSKYIQANLAAGRCTGSWECKWPTNDCVNNRCVKSNGDGGQCSGSWECKWPTPECRNGNCVKSNGDGGECTGSWECKWPYPTCKNGNCEK